MDVNQLAVDPNSYIVAVAVMLVTSVLKPIISNSSSAIRFFVSFAVTFIASVLYMASKEMLTHNSFVDVPNVIVTFATIFTISQTMYKLIWSPTTIDQKIADRVDKTLS